LSLRLPDCDSLKEKRSVIGTLSSALRSKLGVAVAEVDHQDLHRRATLGVAAVADGTYHVRRVLQSVERRAECHPGVEVLDTQVELFSPEE